MCETHICTRTKRHALTLSLSLAHKLRRLWLPTQRKWQKQQRGNQNNANNTCIVCATSTSSSRKHRRAGPFHMPQTQRERVRMNTPRRQHRARSTDPRRRHKKHGAWCPWQQGVRTLFGVVDVLSAISPKPAVDIGSHEPGDEVCSTIHKMKMT